jgi:hypothetical protein
MTNSPNYLCKHTLHGRYKTNAESWNKKEWDINNTEWNKKVIQTRNIYSRENTTDKLAWSQFSSLCLHEPAYLSTFPFAFGLLVWKKVLQLCYTCKNFKNNDTEQEEQSILVNYGKNWVGKHILDIWKGCIDTCNNRRIKNIFTWQTIKYQWNQQITSNCLVLPLFLVI